MNTKKIISTLIKAAKELGLDDFDINNSTEFLDNREYGLAFDTIITQLYEYEIDNEFYELIVKSAHKMEILEDEYSFMKELVGVGDWANQCYPISCRKSMEIDTKTSH